jgi:flagellar motor switch protein FliN
MITTTPSAETKLNGAVAAAGHSRIDAVGVTVETYLGGAQMTVAELNALQNGALIALDQALNALVELRVNGVPIARGELVAVGDKFGVRIIAISP